MNVFRERSATAAAGKTGGRHHAAEQLLFWLSGAVDNGSDKSFEWQRDWQAQWACGLGLPFLLPSFTLADAGVFQMPGGAPVEVQ